MKSQSINNVVTVRDVRNKLRGNLAESYCDIHSPQCEPHGALEEH